LYLKPASLDIGSDLYAMKRLAVAQTPSVLGLMEVLLIFKSLPMDHRMEQLVVLLARAIFVWYPYSVLEFLKELGTIMEIFNLLESLVKRHVYRQGDC
jgi:hypothetical protein